MICPSCGGSGSCRSCNGSGRITCPACNGMGTEKQVCNVCGGSGQYQGNVCNTCNGSGIITATCSYCNGAGTKSCSDCNGTGVCRACNGTGQIAARTRPANEPYIVPLDDIRRTRLRRRNSINPQVTLSLETSAYWNKVEIIDLEFDPFDPANENQPQYPEVILATEPDNLKSSIPLQVRLSDSKTSTASSTVSLTKGTSTTLDTSFSISIPLTGGPGGPTAGGTIGMSETATLRLLAVKPRRRLRPGLSTYPSRCLHTLNRECHSSLNARSLDWHSRPGCAFTAVSVV